MRPIIGWLALSMILAASFEVYPMRFNYNGVYIKHEDFVDEQYVKEVLREAFQALTVIRDSNDPEMEQEVWTRRNAKFQIKSVFGKEEITIFPPPVPVKKHKETVADRQKVLLYLPAFHAYDEDGSWLGIVICVSGKWGPPYRLLLVEEERIYPFEYGLWNTGVDAIKPEDYNLRSVMSMFWEGFDEQFLEVPADHTYTGKKVETDVTENLVVTYLEPPRAVINCNGSLSDGHVARWGEIDTARDYIDHVALVDDWELYYDDYYSWKASAPKVRGFHEYEDRHDLILWGTCGHSGARCELITEWVYDCMPTVDWDSLASLGRTEETNEETYYGEDPEQPGSTFAWGETDDTEIEDSGFYIVGIKNVGGTWYRHTDAASGLTETGSDSSTFADYAYVFGEKHLLKDLGESGQDGFSRSWDYYNHDYRIRGAEPRIYLTHLEKELRWALASFRRVSTYLETYYWEYVCFTGDLAQADDPNAMYEDFAGAPDDMPMHYIDGVYHDGKQVYGNGEFSLIMADISYYNEEEF